MGRLLQEKTSGKPQVNSYAEAQPGYSNTVFRES